MSLRATADAHVMRILKGDTMKYDVFLSHASEDKESVARPLFERLSSIGCKVWFDEATLEIGDSIRRSIDKGLAESQFGVVIISRSFIGKGWTEYELDALTELEMKAGSKRILPLWHDVTHTDVCAWSPALANRLAIRDKSIDEAARLALIRQ